ncbi:MAG: hypothetical protein GY851_23760 [bacterium]|nr:hypothetical protein [bacterium]
MRRRFVSVCILSLLAAVLFPGCPETTGTGGSNQSPPVEDPVDPGTPDVDDPPETPPDDIDDPATSSWAGYPGAVVHAEWCVPDVEAQFSALKHHGEWMGFHKHANQGPYCDALPPTEIYDNHNQGLVRRPGRGTPYLVLTRSAEALNSSTILVVKMRSRNTTGERMRSNRMLFGVHVDSTIPPAADEVVYHFTAPPSTGSVGDSHVYLHPGCMQIVDDIVPIPCEKPVAPGDPHAKVIFMDLSPLPAEPTFLSYSLDLDGDGGRPEHDAGILGMTKLPEPDGRYLMAFTWGHNEKVEFWLTNVTDLRDLGHLPPPGEEARGVGRFELYDEWDHSEVSGYWPVKTDPPPSLPPYVGCYQGIDFVWDDDGRLYMVALRNTDSTTPTAAATGHDEARLYRVGLPVSSTTGLLQGGGPVTLTEVASKHMWTQVLGWGIGDSKQANFAAGTGLYVSPMGEMILYASEHWTMGPGDTYKMAEFRHRDVYHPNSPAYAPRVDVRGTGGGYMVKEGSSIVLDCSDTQPPVAEPWVEAYEDTGYTSDSVMFDLCDKAKRTWHNFSRIDDKSILHDGFDDAASSLRWFAPPGGHFTIYSDFSSTGATKLPLNGAGEVSVIRNLHTNNNGDKFSSLSFSGASRGTVLGYNWLIRTVPPLGELSGDLLGETPTYNAIEGTYVDGSVSIESVDCTGFSNLYWEHGINAFSTETAYIAVFNLSPEAHIDTVSDPDGVPVDANMPVLVENVPYTLDGSFADAGVVDTHTADVDWDDGAMSSSGQPGFQLTDCLGGATGSLSVSHAYSAAGVFTIGLDVEDDDGDSGYDTRQVEVVTAEDATWLAIEWLRELLAKPSPNHEARRLLLNVLSLLEGNENGVETNGVVDFLAADMTEDAALQVDQSLALLDVIEKTWPALLSDTGRISAMLENVAKSLAS